LGVRCLLIPKESPLRIYSCNMLCDNERSH